MAVATWAIPIVAADLEGCELLSTIVAELVYLALPTTIALATISVNRSVSQQDSQC